MPWGPGKENISKRKRSAASEAARRSKRELGLEAARPGSANRQERVGRRARVARSLSGARLVLTSTVKRLRN